MKAAILPSSNIFVNQNGENQKYPSINSSPSSQSYSLLFEDLNNKDRATLQIEVVDVNDNPPYFLGGPFPLELIIPAGSPPGVLIRRLEIIDFDQGIGGISKFSLIPEDNKNNSLFSLNSPQCKWPKCSVELRLKESMFEGERASIKILARDGAGITHKRSNTAEIKINVVAVADRANNLNKMRGKRKKKIEKKRRMNLMKRRMKYSLIQILEIIFLLNKILQLKQRQKDLLVFPLITFVKRRNNHEEKIKSTTLQTIKEQIIKNIIPKTFNVESLSEDAPVGLELLHIPLPSLNKTSSIQFIQLDGSNSLKMLPNGSIQISQPLNFENTPILKAEIKLNKENNLLAKINVKINSIINKFKKWLEKEFKVKNNENGTIIIKLNKSGNNNFEEGKDFIKLIKIPEELVKYVNLENNKNELFQLKGQQLLILKNKLSDLQTLHSLNCVILKLTFRKNFESKNICVEIPKLEETPIKLLWPLNNSIHLFPENQELPALLAIITNSSNVVYSIFEKFKDGDKFSINSINGKLYYKEYLNNSYLNSFDYERQNIYLILINICSIKKECQKLFLQIKVLDLNDNCPKFNFLKEENEWNIDIKEDEIPNKNIPINQFPEAIDLDGSEEQKSKCYKLVENKGGTFGILIPERPEIYLIKGLDRELIPSYQLKIIVEDCSNIKQKCNEGISKKDNSSSYSSFIYLNINIIDINDNSPQFLIKHFFAAIIDISKKEQPFLQLKADDLDEGDKYNLRYSWGEGMIQTFEEPISMSNIPFNLNRSTGELSIKEDVDLSKTAIKSYTFRVRVNDPLPAQHEDQTTVTVSLLNPNEHLLELYIFRNNDIDDLDLIELESILSSIVQNNINLTNTTYLNIKYIPIYRLFQCGRENCLILNIYFLDNLFQPINSFIGLQIIKNIFKLNNTRNKLKEKFGIIGFEEKSFDINNSFILPSFSSSSSNNALINSTKLFTNLNLLIFILIIILALLLPLIYLFLILIRFIKKCQQKSSKINKNYLKKQNNNYKISSIFLEKNKNNYLNNEYLMDERNSYIPFGMLKQQLRWKSNNSDDFEFPLPPPVSMYGSGTLTIPKARILPGGGLATEF
uniref:Cadherin domain-containing protein n=2 Tax=Meloidogyne enterolobii TaxID=390850 RepID=A0A6V7VW93_MELEN|nr:unnamed protein product [Meloidogyne enterolobii]